MRAKEFIIEQHSIEAEKRTKSDVRQLGQKQPKKEYHPSKFKSGKLGVPKTPMQPYDISSQHEDNNEYGSKRGDLSDEASAAMPGAFNVETLPSDFYGVYRLGIGLAAGDRNITAADNIGKHPFFMPFAPEEHDRFEKEIARQGHKVKSRTTPQSLELSTVNTTTPVAKRKANKYGI